MKAGKEIVSFPATDKLKKGKTRLPLCFIAFILMRVINAECWLHLQFNQENIHMTMYGTVNASVTASAGSENPGIIPGIFTHSNTGEKNGY
ncbi:MAG: hypothetical protein JXB88_04130 [Spirochaetales bacterium]|nr:hypothetical protein [Spirochaetales bacterium]